jgi:ketopantoate reductase
MGSQSGIGRLWYSGNLMRVFVLGVGATGSLLLALLTRQGHHVSCGDRDPVRAHDFLEESSKVVIQRVNARNLQSVVQAAKAVSSSSMPALRALTTS